MEAYQKQFIEFLLETGALKLSSETEDFSLKSGRRSPWFVNLGDFSDGVSARELGRAYAGRIQALLPDLSGTLLFGPAYKGIPLAVATSIALGEAGKAIGFAFDRKEVKAHGEATGADLQKQMIVGSKIPDGTKIVILDDVLTTGATKNDALELLGKVAKNLQYPGLVIGVDRQEVGIDGVSAVQKFAEQNKIPVVSIVNAVEVFQYLKELSKEKAYVDPRALERISNYLRVYGTSQARKELGLGPLEQRIVRLDRSVIPACDIDELDKFKEVVAGTAGNPKIGGYKIGFELGYGGKGWGLADVVEVAKSGAPEKTVIFDHQKAGSDIPDTGKNFARKMKKAGVDAVIFFPQAGPETERAWIYHAFDQGLKVIVGGRMTHPAYAVSEGGFITDEGALMMYRIAAQAGVSDFVVPGNKPQVIAQIKELVREEGIHNPTFYAPGFVTQGGDVSEAAKVAGDRFHAIVGRDIMNAPDKKAAADKLTSKL